MTAGARRALIAATALSLAGCSTSFWEGKRIEYKSAEKLPSLEVPPDLTAPARDDHYQVPDVSPSGTATLSKYNAERKGGPGPAAASTTVLPEVAKARV